MYNNALKAGILHSIKYFKSPTVLFLLSNESKDIFQKL